MLEKGGMELMSGKTGLVTGAAMGIGRGVARVMARHGANVVLADLEHTRHEAEAIVNDITAAGGKALFIPCDVAESADARKLVDATIQNFGALDFAVNNAGVMQKLASLTDVSEEEFDRILKVNTYGVFYCLKAQIPAMLSRGGGAIVNIASTASFNAYSKIGSYVASKHAVLGLTRNAAMEFGEKGIRVNCICPAGIRTPMMDSTPPEMLQEVLKPQFIKRLGEPEDIGEAAAWLCSDLSGFVTGVALPVDGGTLVGGV